LILRALFRAAFAVCILVQIVLCALLLALISHYWPSDVLLALFFIGLFLIGAGSYGEFQWLTRVEGVRLEAERWLAERRHPNPRRLKRRKTIKRWAVWMPTVIVVVACLCFDGLWALTTHLLYPGRGRLIRYEVPIPLNWTIIYPDLDTSRNGAHSTVVAARYRGMLLAGSGLYVGRRPPFSISTMNFRSTPAGDPLATRPATTIISERTLLFGKGTIVCWEEVPPRWMMSPRYIRCSTSTGDFSGNFNGRDEDASEFYRTLEGTKPTK
jgi:hypothetical protein